MWFFLYEIHLKISQTLQMLTLSEFVVGPQEIIIAGLKWIVKIKIKRPGQISHIIGGNGKKYLQFSKRSDWRVFKEFYFLMMFSHHGKIVNDCIFIESDICCKRVDIFNIRLERNRKVDNLPVCAAHMLRKSEVICCRTFRFVLKTGFYHLSDVVFLTLSKPKSIKVCYYSLSHI